MDRTDKPNQVELSGSGSRVDIVSIPCAFHAPKYELLDQLFVPLLASAQQASDLMGLRLGDDLSALRAASYLAGELLRDNSFVPIRSFFTGTAHSYVIDLPTNHFHAETAVFSQGGNATSMFRVKVTGAIRGDKFVVVDPVTNTSLFSFTRFEAEKQDFFARDFPFLARETRRDPTLYGREDGLAQGVVDIVLGVPVSGETIMVRIHKQAGSSSGRQDAAVECDDHEPPARQSQQHIQVDRNHRQALVGECTQSARWSLTVSGNGPRIDYF